MNSKELFEESKRLMPGGVNSPVRAFRGVGGNPFFTARAEGCELTTCDGDVLIDMVCSWGPAIFGHNHPAIRQAIRSALDNGTSFGTPSFAELEMARLINEMVPCAQMVRMTNSGTEATMSCVRLMRGFTGRDRIVKFEGCYHGHTDSLLVKAGSGALTFGNPDSAGVPADLAKLTTVLPFNDFEALEDCFSKFGEQIAGVILEPYPANVGLIVPKDGFLKRIRQLCDKYGALLVFDEVITGFRMSKGGAQEYCGIVPDLCALGKIIGGGLPVGAFCGRADIMENVAPLGKVYQAGTLSGNPLAMAAGVAALNLIKQTNPYGELEKKAKFLVSAALEAAEKKGIGLQAPRAASLFSFFFNDEKVENCAQAMNSSRELYAKFFHECLSRGLYLAPSAFEICFISAAHTQEHLEKASEILKKSIEAI